MYPHSHSFWNGKRKQARISKSYNLLIFTIKLPQKDEMMMKMKPCIEKWDEDEWDENETLHLIMMMVKTVHRKLFTLKK